MKRILIFLVAVAAMLTCRTPTYGAMTYDQAYYRSNTSYLGSGGISDPLYNLFGTVEGLYEGTEEFDAIRLMESAGATYYTKIQAGDQSGNLTLTLPTGYATTGYVLSSTNTGVLSWVANGGTWAGGAVTSDATLANGVDILSSTTTAHTNAIQGYADAGAYKDILRWTNAAAVTAVLGASDVVFSLASTGLDISTAGAISNAGGITNTGVLTSAGGATNLNTSGADAANIGTGTYSGTVTIGNNGASVAFATSAWDLTGAGALSGISTFSLSDDITMANGKGVKSSTTTAESVGVYGYDVGVGYVGALVVTNSATPATVLGNTSGTTAISSSDWAVSTAGVMTGMGAITSDGLFTGSGGETLTGTVSINDSATTSTTSIGGGTTTGAVNVATGASAQSVSIANGAAAKTVALGSSNTTSTTTILGGDNGVNINVDNLNNPTNINTSGSTGTVTVGGTGAMTIDIGAGGTGAKTITIGDNTTATATAIKGGSGDITLTSSDDISLVGDAGSLFNIGVHAGGVAVHIADDNTTADTVVIGSALDTTSLVGVSVTVGSTGTTSTTTIQSGSGGIGLNASNNQPTNIGTGTSTGTVTIGGAAAQTINIGDGAAVKAVTLGSNNATSATTLLSGTTAGALSLNATAGGAVTNIGTGTTTGAITVGGTGTQAIGVGNGLGAKAVTVGSKTGASATILQSGSADLDLDAAGAVDIDAVTTFDVLAGGAFSIDGSNAASNVTLATNGAADDLTIGLTGATDSSIILNSTGTGSDAVGFVASAGGISASGALELSILGMTTQQIAIEGTANAFEARLKFTDPTADVNFVFPVAAEADYAVMTSTLTTNAADIANSVSGASNELIFEGSSADGNEIHLTAANATADVLYTFPDAAAATYGIVPSSLTTNAVNIVNSVWGGTNQLIFEGATADAYETAVAVIDPNADVTITLPDKTGAVPVVIKQVYGATLGSIYTTDATDVNESSISCPDEWFDPNSELIYELAGVKTGANGTMTVYLYLDDGIQCTLTSSGNTAGDWYAKITVHEYTDNAKQFITGYMVTADGGVTDVDTDTTDFADGAATTVKIQLDLSHADDSNVCNFVKVSCVKGPSDS